MKTITVVNMLLRENEKLFKENEEIKQINEGLIELLAEASEQGTYRLVYQRGEKEDEKV